MTPVRIVDYFNFGRTYLLSDNGTYIAAADAPSGEGCSGMGGLVRVGLLNPANVFSALYESNGEVWLQVGAEKFEMHEGGLQVRPIKAPGVRRFALSDGARGTVLERWYWFLGLADPWPDSGDFFEYVARSMAARGAVARFRCYWQARSTSSGPITEAELDTVAKCAEGAMTRS